MTPEEVRSAAREVAHKLMLPDNDVFDLAVSLISAAIQSAYAQGEQAGRTKERERCAAIARRVDPDGDYEFAFDGPQIAQAILSEGEQR